MVYRDVAKKLDLGTMAIERATLDGWQPERIKTHLALI